MQLARLNALCTCVVQQRTCGQMNIAMTQLSLLLSLQLAYAYATHHISIRFLVLPGTPGPHLPMSTYPTWKQAGQNFDRELPDFCIEFSTTSCTIVRSSEGTCKLRVLIAIAAGLDFHKLSTAVAVRPQIICHKPLCMHGFLKAPAVAR